VTLEPRLVLGACRGFTDRFAGLVRLRWALLSVLSLALSPRSVHAHRGLWLVDAVYIGRDHVRTVGYGEIHPLDTQEGFSRSA